jgi:hypothetical protein
MDKGAVSLFSETAPLSILGWGQFYACINILGGVLSKTGHISSFTTIVPV